MGVEDIDEFNTVKHMTHLHSPVDRSNRNTQLDFNRKKTNKRSEERRGSELRTNSNSATKNDQEVIQMLKF